MFCFCFVLMYYAVHIFVDKYLGLDFDVTYTKIMIGLKYTNGRQIK